MPYKPLSELVHKRMAELERGKKKDSDKPFFRMTSNQIMRAVRDLKKKK